MHADERIAEQLDRAPRASSGEACACSAAAVRTGQERCQLGAEPVSALRRSASPAKLARREASSRRSRARPARVHERLSELGRGEQLPGFRLCGGGEAAQRAPPPAALRPSASATQPYRRRSARLTLIHEGRLCRQLGQHLPQLQAPCWRTLSQAICDGTAAPHASDTGFGQRLCPEAASSFALAARSARPIAPRPSSSSAPRRRPTLREFARASFPSRSWRTQKPSGEEKARPGAPRTSCTACAPARKAAVNLRERGHHRARVRLVARGASSAPAPAERLASPRLAQGTLRHDRPRTSPTKGERAPTPTARQPARSSSGKSTTKLGAPRTPECRPRKMPLSVHSHRSQEASALRGLLHFDHERPDVRHSAGQGHLPGPRRGAHAASRSRPSEGPRRKGAVLEGPDGTSPK